MIAPRPDDERVTGLVTRPVDRVLAALCLLLWLVPIAIVGFTSKPVVPVPELAWLHNLACLFERRQSTWTVYHVEIRTVDGADWSTLPFEGFAPMEVFGYVSRLDRRIRRLYELRNRRRFVPEISERARAQETALAEWVRRRWEALHPDGPRLAGVRFLRTEFAVEDLADPVGHWDKSSFMRAAAADQRRFGEVGFE